jgi:hypothetical protein
MNHLPWLRIWFSAVLYCNLQQVLLHKEQQTGY